MAFNFGAPAAPAPATGGFGFGASSTTPTPAPSAFSFGGTSTTAAPAGGAGGGLFGSTGTAPAGGGLFGSTSSTAPAPTGGIFGSTTPAPAAGGWFGASAPAPSTGGLFGITSATPASLQQQQQQQQHAAPISGNTPYSQLPEAAKKTIDGIYQLMMQHRRTIASVKTMAPSLLVVEDSTADGRQLSGGGNGGIGVSGILRGPSPSSPADAAAGFSRRSSSSSKSAAVLDPSSLSLPQQIIGLETQINTLLRSAETNLTEAQQLKLRAETAVRQAQLRGALPIETIAARRGVALSSLGASTALGGSVGSVAGGTGIGGTSSVGAYASTLQYFMDLQAANVDRIEVMPSPYLWEVLHHFELRLAMVQRDVDAVRSRLQIAEEAERVQSSGRFGDETVLLLAHGDNFNAATSIMLYEGGGPLPLSKRLATLARSQNDLFLNIASQAARAHEGLEEVKARFRRHCESVRGGYYEDPFLKADVEEVRREREVQQRIMARRIASDSTLGWGGGGESAAPVAGATGQAPAAVGGLFGSTPAPSSGGLFGSTPAPASGGLFGSTSAPSSGGLFGSTPAPASGGLFGSTPAPASGGLFGSTPAPASGGLFGSTPAPAGGGLFGAPAPASGSLFGSSTPAPAFGSTPAAAGSAFSFGAPAPGAAAPAAGGLFAAPTTPAPTLAPRKKSGSRSGGRSKR